MENTNTGSQIRESAEHEENLEQTHFTELTENMFENVVWSSVEEGLQGWKVGADLQDALQSSFTLGIQKVTCITSTSGL